MIDLPFTLDQLRIIKAIASEGSFKIEKKNFFYSFNLISVWCGVE